MGICDIIGIVDSNKVASQIIDSLKLLEYRRYDSAGIATFDNKKINLVKSEGKIRNLKKKLEKNFIDGHIRWVTHGAPTDINAHQQLLILHEPEHQKV